MRTRLQIPREKQKPDKVVMKEYQSTRKLKLLLLHLRVYFFHFPTIIIRYLMEYLFFIMPRFEKDGELCQGFQTFLNILKARVYNTSITEYKIPIFNPVGFCVIFEEY